MLSRGAGQAGGILIRFPFHIAAARLYPPRYRQNLDKAVESVTVTLLNHERPRVWDEVNGWLDHQGSIANADLCRIANVDTLKASRMLRDWVEGGALLPMPAGANGTWPTSSQSTLKKVWACYPVGLRIMRTYSNLTILSAC